MLVLPFSRRSFRSAARCGLGALAALLCGPVLGAGCSNDFFACSSDSECTDADGGRCEPSGACSFPDAACPTGRRYGEAGNPQVAGTCVPPEDLGSTGATATGGSGGSGGASSSTGGSESTSAAAGSGTSTMDASSSTAAGTSSGSSDSSSDGTSSTSTGDQPLPPDMYAPCGTPEECSNMTCVVLIIGGGQAGYCTAGGCGDPTVDCTDPGTGATPVCAELSLNGAPGLVCALDCGVSGTPGCPAGMTCYGNIKGQPPLCFY